MAEDVVKLTGVLSMRVDKRSIDNVNKALGNVKKLAVGVAGFFAGRAAVRGIRDMVEEVRSLGDNLDKVSKKLGVSSDFLQDFQFAANLTGVNVNTANLALQRFIRRAAEAAKGTGEAKAAFKELGLELKDTATGNLRDTKDLLFDVADGLKNGAISGDQLRLAFKLFDSEGAALVTTLKGGSKELEGFFKQSQALGKLNKTLIKQSAELTDRQLKFGRAMLVVKSSIFSVLGPALGVFLDIGSKFIKRNKKFFVDTLPEILDIGIAASIDILNNFVTAVRKGFAKIRDVVGGFSGLGEAFGMIKDNLKPVVDMLDPFNTRLGKSVTLTSDMAEALNSLGEISVGGEVIKLVKTLAGFSETATGRELAETLNPEGELFRQAEIRGRMAAENFMAAQAGRASAENAASSVIQNNNQVFNLSPGQIGIEALKRTITETQSQFIRESAKQLGR